MSQEKDKQGLDMVFPFVAGFTDDGTGLTEKAPMKKAHTTYSGLIRC